MSRNENGEMYWKENDEMMKYLEWKLWNVLEEERWNVLKGKWYLEREMMKSLESATPYNGVNVSYGYF